MTDRTDTLPPATIWACVLGSRSCITDTPYVASQLRAKGWTVTPLHGENTVRRLLAERIAEAVAAEREACAKACDDIAVARYALYKGHPPYTGRELGRADPGVGGQSDGADDCASAIRARGEARNG